MTITVSTQVPPTNKKIEKNYKKTKNEFLYTIIKNTKKTKTKENKRFFENSNLAVLMLWFYAARRADHFPPVSDFFLERKPMFPPKIHVPQKIHFVPSTFGPGNQFPGHSDGWKSKRISKSSGWVDSQLWVWGLVYFFNQNNVAHCCTLLTIKHPWGSLSILKDRQEPFFLLLFF